MDNKIQSGFTLIEILVAVAVAAILLGIGIPSFSGAIKNSQVSSDYNELTQALYLARSEAIKSGTPITVCPRKTDTAQQCGTTQAHWDHGWLVFQDNQLATGENNAEVGPLDVIIAIHPPKRSDNDITAKGSIDRTRNTVSDRTYIRYSSDGSSNWGNGSFLLCDYEEFEHSRVLNVAPTGDVRPGRPSGSDYPRDVFTDEVCKP